MALCFFGIGKKTGFFYATTEFSKFADILSAALSQNHLLGFEVAQQIDGETIKTVTDFIFLVSENGDCSLEIKRLLLLGRKAKTNLDSILKSRHYFADKGPNNQIMVLQWSCIHVRVGP